MAILLVLACACIGAGFLAPAAHAAEPASAAMVRKAVPAYPASALRDGLEGTVHVRLRVLADGQPSDVSVHKSSGAQALDQAAVTAATQSGFRPARNGEGAPVEAWVIVPYRFVLEDAPKPEATRPAMPNPAPEAP